MSEIKSREINLVSIDSLIPHPKNMNEHTDSQIERLVSLIEYQGFRDPLIVQAGTNLVVAGHGRLMAAKKMGLEKVPVTFQEFDNQAQLYSFMVSHNAINASNWGGGLDLGQINTDIIEFGPELDIDHLGLYNFTIEPLDNLDDDITETIKDDMNKKFILEIEFPNDMEMMDIHDDLSARGYLCKVKG